MVTSKITFELDYEEEVLSVNGNKVTFDFLTSLHDADGKCVEFHKQKIEGGYRHYFDVKDAS